MADDMRKKLEELDRERHRLREPDPARQKAIDRQHARGKLTAAERMDLLFDEGEFMETGAWGKPRLTGFDIDNKELAGDGVIAGWGRVDRRPVYAYAQDFTKAAGTVATVHAKRALRVMRQALKARKPMLHLIDSGGVRVQDAVTRDYNEAYPAYFQIQSISSGVIPQIGLLMGPCAAGAAYSPILCDFLIMVEGTSHMYVASPTLIKSAQFVDVTEDEVGGAKMHATISGCCDLLAGDDEDCIAKAKKLLSYLPAHNQEKPPLVKTGDDPARRSEKLLDIVPGNSKKPYDMHRVVEEIVDRDSFFELKPDFAKNMITGFARLDGRPVGLIANNPMHLAGSIDINAAVKEARFIRFCDCFSIPLVFLVDTPAYLPGVDQEQGGIIRHGAKVLHAISEATVPKLSVVVRKGYGGGLIAMCNEPMGCDLMLAWPSAEMGLMSPEGAVGIIYRNRLKEADDPDELRRRCLEDYNRTLGRFPYHAAEMRWVEEIIDPRDTRRLLIRGLATYEDKREERPWKKQGNIPL